MIYKQIPVSQLREHPQNRKYFSDIESVSKSFWKEFKANIENIGIIEALVVNQDSMEVVSGNQRLKAARELGIETVPCILCKSTDPEDEIRKMISANVMRRELDPITLFEYIGILRAGYDGVGRSDPGQDPRSIGAIAETLKKKGTFISAADIYNSLSEEQQKELRAWFYKQEERPTDGQLIAKVKELEKERLITGKTIENLKLEIKKRVIALEAAQKEQQESGAKNENAIKELRRDLRVLRDAAKGDKELEAFQKTLTSTEKAIAIASAEISDLLSRAEKIGKNTELQGLARARLTQGMMNLLNSIKRLQVLVPARIADGRK